MSSSSVAGDAKDKDISWFSPNGEKLTPNQQRISVVWNDDSSSTLTIYNANIDDAGIYKCVVTGEDGSESEATVNVKIFRESLLFLFLCPLHSFSIWTSWELSMSCSSFLSLNLCRMELRAPIGS